MRSVMLSIKEAAAKSKLSEAHVRQLLREGKIKGVKAGKEWRITTQELDRFLGIRTDTQSLEKDLYIKDLESRVKTYEVKINTFQNLVNTLETIISN